MSELPYKVAVLVYLRDADGRVLLLHRRKLPNIDRYSPVGGKLETGQGESPHECAVREVSEETGLRLQPNEVRMSGIVSERGYEGQTHWLIFLFEVTRAVHPSEIPLMEFDEGKLEWVPEDQIESLAIPNTDRTIMWPAVRAHAGGFFMVEIDCSVKPMTHRIVESWKSVRAH
ncbi:MAG: NUDIX domain-containing protein [Phycisphaerae bacterium]|nr:NUDIX domain-containing protein [Phycisphaerae bacterium]